MPPVGKSRSNARADNSPKRRCWTCQDRKIACDLGLPKCRNCTRSGRECRGYGLRLSWPPDKKTARMIVAKSSSSQSWNTVESIILGFVNTTFWDIELHHSLAAIVTDRPRLPYPIKVYMPNLGLISRSIEDRAQDLMIYFTDVVVKAFVFVESDAQQLSSLLFRLAFADDSPSSVAAIRAVLALSSLYRYGFSHETMTLKVSAISALKQSLDCSVGSKEIQQHIVVGLLLCLFELYVPTATSFQWPIYICGAITMLSAVKDHRSVFGGDAELLLLWLNYHYVLGRFTMRHWRPLRMGCNAKHIIPEQGTVSVYKFMIIPQEKVIGVLGCSPEVFEIIARISALSQNSNSDLSGDVLDAIEYDLTVVRQQVSDTEPVDEAKTLADVAELYRLATLIYLERALRKENGASTKVDSWARESFTIISQLDSCPRRFPLLIIGYEARTEDQRGALLNLLARTKERHMAYNVYCVQQLMESMWIQVDLQADAKDGPDYWSIFNAIIGSPDVLPPLA